ncbi:hypothetical protein [Chthonobacter rhizosphaerae]|uniref:hypothetical protein n=1 Tax=Chthonobacter rhizosphaerae TaxID=2735553 RepID=UPI0015EF8E8E|nr:hypothetical protein [Chthonobacter rhizosphaerae]
MRLALAAALAIAAALPATAAPNPAKARDCRGEMAKMVAMGLILHAEKTGPVSMNITLDPIKWRVMPTDMKRAVGTTIACVATDADDLDAVGSEITFVTGDERTPVGRMVGTELRVE